MRNVDADRRMDQMQDSLYGLEHSAAWVMAVLALVLAVLGTLVGLGVIDLRDTEGIPGSSGPEGSFLFSNNFWDGAMLLFSAATLGLLALCLHANDHHRLRDLSSVEKKEQGMWSVEHGLAYIVGLGSVVYVIIGLLVGFNALSSTHDQGDGLIWIWFGLGSAAVTAALHFVRHHQAAVERDYIVGLVEERVRGFGTTGAATQQRGTQPR